MAEPLAPLRAGMGVTVLSGRLSSAPASICQPPLPPTELLRAERVLTLRTECYGHALTLRERALWGRWHSGPTELGWLWLCPPGGHRGQPHACRASGCPSGSCAGLFRSEGAARKAGTPRGGTAGPAGAAASMALFLSSQRRPGLGGHQGLANPRGVRVSFSFLQQTSFPFPSGTFSLADGGSSASQRPARRGENSLLWEDPAGPHVWQRLPAPQTCGS